MRYYYNRYGALRLENENMVMPYIKIPKSATDKISVYRKGITRFDKLSEDYYGNPFHGFLIMCANPQINGMEFDIEDGTVLRIPFPFENALTLYNDAIKAYIKFEGLK